MLLRLDLCDRHPAPHLGVEEDGQHASEQEGPPRPVAGDAARADDVGDEVRGVGRERSGDHRHAQEPPGHRAPGQEEVG